MKLPTIHDAERFIARHLPESMPQDVYVTGWGGSWRIVTHSRRPGALLAGRFNAFIEAQDLLDAVLETVRQRVDANAD